MSKPLRTYGTIRPSTSATLASVAGATSSTTILAANANRVGAIIFNDSAAILYLRLSDSGAATSANRSLDLAPGDVYELPYGYQGLIVGIWESATGNARVTEFT